MSEREWSLHAWCLACSLGAGMLMYSCGEVRCCGRWFLAHYLTSVFRKFDSARREADSVTLTRLVPPCNPSGESGSRQRRDAERRNRHLTKRLVP